MKTFLCMHVFVCVLAMNEQRICLFCDARIMKNVSVLGKLSLMLSGFSNWVFFFLYVLAGIVEFDNSSSYLPRIKDRES
jgi:hypothetical protein